MPTQKSRFSGWTITFGVLFFGALGYFLLADLHRISQGKRGDFLHFFYAAKALDTGKDPYTAWEGGYIYPPLVAFLYRPISRMEEVHAIRTMLVVNVTLVGLAIYIAARAYTARLDPASARKSVLLVMILAMFFNLDKVRLELVMCQTNVEVFLMFCLALLWLDKRPVLSGIALGFGFNIKYLALPMLPYLILRRRWVAAASFIPSILFFALLPAIESGWNQNLVNLSVAFRGLLQLMGMPGSAVNAAHIEPVDAFWSVSITSGAFAHRFGAGVPPLIAVGSAVALFTTAVALIYRTYQVPLVAWPGSLEQSSGHWPARVAMEWTGLIVFTLAFSPQTNTAHLFNALAVTTPVAVLLVSKRISKSSKLILIVGLLVMIGGFSLPPGDFNNKLAARRVLNWKRAGGPCWCFLVSYLALLWASMRPRSLPNAQASAQSSVEPRALQTSPLYETSGLLGASPT